MMTTAGPLAQADCKPALAAADKVIAEQDKAIALFQSKAIELLDENARLERNLQRLREEADERSSDVVTYSAVAFTAGLLTAVLVGR